jgi:DNA-binding transcriptional ArsR family regulator
MTTSFDRTRRPALTRYSNIRIYASMKIDTDAMTVAADRAAELLKSLANRHRLLIVCQLIEKERSVGELTAFLGIRDSTVSQHLAVLRREGIVSARRDGQTIWYSIGSASARSVVESLYRSFCAPGQAAAPAAKAKSGRSSRSLAAPR